MKNRRSRRQQSPIIEDVVVPPAFLAPVSGECAAYQDCLEQAEICREQARAAASCKRFQAARGLFATAIALCRRAIVLGGEACGDAKERLNQLDTEMLVYSELAKSMERPLLMRAAVKHKPPEP